MNQNDQGVAVGRERAGTVTSLIRSVDGSNPGVVTDAMNSDALWAADRVDQQRIWTEKAVGAGIADVPLTEYRRQVTSIQIEKGEAGANARPVARDVIAVR